MVTKQRKRTDGYRTDRKRTLGYRTDRNITDGYRRERGRKVTDKYKTHTGTEEVEGEQTLFKQTSVCSSDL